MGTELYAADDKVIFLTHYQEDGCRRFMYYDKVSEICGVLCGKPECTHDSDECNAIVGASSASVFGMGILNNKIYWIADKNEDEYKGKYIYQMNLDGTDRKEIRRIASPDQRDQMVTSNMFVDYTDDYIIIAGGRHSIVMGIDHHYLTLRAYSLKDPKNDLILYDEENTGSLYFCIAGEDVYYSIATQESMKNTEEWMQNAKLQLYRFNLQKKEVESLYNANVPFYPWELYPFDDKVIFTTISDFYSLNKAYVLDLSTKNFCTSWKTENKRSGFGSCSFVDRGRVINYYYPNNDPSEFGLIVKNSDGTTVLDLISKNTMITEENRGRSHAFAGSDLSNLYFFFNEVIDNVNREWLIAFPLSGEEPKLIYTDYKKEIDINNLVISSLESDLKLKTWIELSANQTEEYYLFDDISKIKETRLNCFIANNTDEDIDNITCSVAVNGNVVTRGYNDKWPSNTSSLCMSEPLFFISIDDFIDGKAIIRFECTYYDISEPDKLINIYDEIIIVLEQ